MVESSPGKKLKQLTPNSGENDCVATTNGDPRGLSVAEDNSLQAVSVVYQNGLHFLSRGSGEKQVSSYTVLPRVTPSPSRWKMFCKPDSGVPSEHFTYYKLKSTDSDNCLSVLVDYCDALKQNRSIVGLIVINCTSSRHLQIDGGNEIIYPSIPIYVVPLEDGKLIEKFVSTHNEGDIQVKVTVECNVDLFSPGSPTLTRQPPPGKRISNKASNLIDDLKILLFVNKKEKVHVCADPHIFQSVFHCFQNYEDWQRKGSCKHNLSDKAIKMLDNNADDMFTKDFLFYLLLGYRFLLYEDVYGNSEVVDGYFVHCLEKFEATLDVQTISSVLSSFIQCGDFMIEFHYSPKNTVSVHERLYEMTSAMLERSNKLQEMRDKNTNGIYRRILWINMKIFFGLKLNVDHQALTATWDSDFHNEVIVLAFSDGTVDEFERGFQLCHVLQFPKEVLLNPTDIALLLSPLKLIKISLAHTVQILHACEKYLHWTDSTSVWYQFLPPLRDNYLKFLQSSGENWKAGEKHSFYEKALSFLDYLCKVMDHFKQNDEGQSILRDFIKNKIQSWIELLLENVDIHADDAVSYFNLLREKWEHCQRFRSFVDNWIKQRGIEVVNQVKLKQFFCLFYGLPIWDFQFVEKFLSTYTIPKDVDITEPIWKELLTEVVHRFSGANYKNKIKEFIKRVGDAYKSSGRVHAFVISLMKLDVDDLLFVENPKQDDPHVEEFFIDEINHYIQQNSLFETIMDQIPSILDLKKPENHFQKLIISGIKKGIVPDSTKMRKLGSSDSMKHLIGSSVTAACKSVTSLESLSDHEKFHWSFIALCCSYIQIPHINKIGSDDILLVETLGRVLQTYCISKNTPIHTFMEVPEDINKLHNADVKSYFKWIIHLQSIMIQWQEKFMKEDCNYDAVHKYDNNLRIIARLAAAINTEHLVIGKDEIKKYKQKYCKIYDMLTSVLVKRVEDVGWCTLVQMLSNYGVQLNPKIQEKLYRHVALPGRDSEVLSSVTQQALPDDQSSSNPKQRLMLGKELTLKIIEELESELQEFLHPIQRLMDFLVYFHVHNCQMFQGYLTKNLTDRFEGITDPSDGKLLSSSSKQLSTVEQFAKALDSTESFILSLINGDALWKEISFDESLEKSLQNIDIDSEFQIMCGFPKFKDVSSANKKGMQGIKSMLELFQFSQQILVIPEVCTQYGLHECLKDPKLKRLEGITNSVTVPKDRDKITGQIASDHMQAIWKILGFDITVNAKYKRCFKIFPAVGECNKFYQFVKTKRFVTVEGRSAFRSQVQLITTQLQHEGYNEAVLNQLLVAFEYITPFLDATQSLEKLLKKIVLLIDNGIGFGADSKNDFCQLRTVNSNISTIQLWFSRTEGDTLKNVAKELDCIMKTGYFEMVISLSKNVKFTHGSMRAATDSSTSQILLHFSERASSHNSVSNLREGQKWRSEQIDDFVTKLGFLEAKSVEEPVKKFQQLNQATQKYYGMLLKLRDLGHPDYVHLTEQIYCTEEDRLVKLITSTDNILKEWRQKIKELYQLYDMLLFFSISKVRTLHDTLKNSQSQDFFFDKLVQEIGFLFESNPPAMKKLEAAVSKNFEYFKNSDNQFEDVGKYLQELCSDSSITDHFLCTSARTDDSPVSPEIVHYAPHYNSGQLLRLLFEIYDGVPESFEVFHCSANSTEEDLKLFLHRATKFRYHKFTILEVNLLPYALQEVILYHHLQEVQTVESNIPLNYIETANSILHEMPWIEVKEYKETGPNLSWDGAQQLCNSYVNKGGNDFQLKLVYGFAGDGKTHYIQKQLGPHCVVITINESFTPLSAILKLRSLVQDYNKNLACTIFFNFTVVPSQKNAELRKEYSKLMSTLAWFFFDLLIFGYVEDLETGVAFRLPGGLQWRLFVEVPSQSDDLEHNLDLFRDAIPVFKVLGNPLLIKNEWPYDNDEGVQLVCKYLRAYKNRHHHTEGINRLYNERANKPVQFSKDADLDAEACYNVLTEYMPEHVTKNKVLQRLFIRYMERRCRFLESCPTFIFNSGFAMKFDHTSKSKTELHQMIKHGKLRKQRGIYFTNTTKLGEMLMKIMLQETVEFCKIDVQQKWSTQAHQQLIYEQTGTIRLITSKREDLDPSYVEDLEALGIEIPSIRELQNRKLLDGYLSSSIAVPLENERLQDIDDSEYVLTLDYTIKMLSIHERYVCGVPVIIEGETGVGKTALISMLSKLWNHALFDEWRTIKKNIIETLYKKSLEMDTSNLKDVLKQLNSRDQPHDSHINSDCKYLSVDDLMPILEMSHRVSDAKCLPYYEFISEKLLEMITNVHILELLTVDDVTKSGIRKESIVEKLINNGRHPARQATAELLYILLNGNLIPIFYKLNIHAALTPKEIHNFFAPIIALAKCLEKVNASKEFTEMQHSPVITVFFDELNTSSCMGVLKEIITDRSIEGDPLPPNIFLVAACNPHRGNSVAVHEDESESWVKGSFLVEKLHPTLRFVMWDYGALTENQESDYIKAKMMILHKDFNIVKNIAFSEVVVKCQVLMRKFASEQFVKLGHSEDEAKIRATSCVSQRDIQRVFTFYSWLLKTYGVFENLPTETEGTLIRGSLSSYIKRHPMFNDELDKANQRALLVALGLVYYMRLNSTYREKFAKELDNEIPGIKFLQAFRDEMDFYISNLNLPAGIAKTEALKENVFAMIICTVTKTPLIIVGAPGSSKTLSFSLTISNLKGPESKHKLFRDYVDIFKSLDPHYYQCSRRTTSREIETVFQRAINRQLSHRSYSMPVHCVVFMDEAGLPEESHESLKVLHYHLDQQEVAFVAISNHILDAAKTNRAVSLFRPTASKGDLETLAKGCLCENPNKPPLKLRNNLETIVKFCPAYNKVVSDKRFEKFFGLRDFIHFINYIRRECQPDSITPQLVLQSLERNFNCSRGFEDICNAFLEKMDSSLDGLKQRTIIEILRSSLADKPFNKDNTKLVSTTNIKSSDKTWNTNDTRNEVRYKLIIDPSEDESIIRLLFMFGIINHDNTRTYMCSDFPGDSLLQKINTIAAIRHSAIEGHTVIMSQTDDIHESFYDLFNQHFRRIDDPQSGPRYFANIAIGAHLKPSRVNEEFQCIVVVKESEVKNIPTPFLNRFEKYFISHFNLLNLVLGNLPPCLQQIVKVAYKKVKEFYELLSPSAFYGGVNETVCSLLLSILPKPGNKNFKSSSNDCVVVVDSSFTLPKRTMLLQTLIKSLHNIGGFCNMEATMEELEHDADSIVGLLANLGTKISGAARKLESWDANTLQQWISEAINVLYSRDLLPDYSGAKDVKDFDVKELEASDGAKLVIVLFAQWLVRFMCKKLMQLLTTEAAILIRRKIPLSYLETYLNFQAHFSLKELITRQTDLLSTCGVNEMATKLICYTRSTSSIHQLPATYPRSPLSITKDFENSKQLVEDLICENAANVFLCKLSCIPSQTEFKLQLQAFVDSSLQTVFVMVISMKETSVQTVNHIRVMVEEAENTNRKSNKLFVLLLHFPANMFYDPCYSSLFLCGWDHHYLDTIVQVKSAIVDTKNWFRESCLSAMEISQAVTKGDDDDLVCLQLQEILNKPESVQVIASRILLSIHSEESSLESLSSVFAKCEYVRELLFKKKVAIVLCEKFKSYWKPPVMGDHLDEAAKFAVSRESTLNISDLVDSIYKAAFFNFIAYMIYQISKSSNLELLFNDSCDDATLDLFLKLLATYPIPKLAEIKGFSNTWDCRVHAVNNLDGTPCFPFYSKVSVSINNVIERKFADLNKDSNFLIGGDISEMSVDVQNKEQMFPKLYESVCNEIEIILKGDKKVSEDEYMSAVAIREMQNDERMWQKYYSDFTYQYMHVSAASEGVEHRLAQLMLKSVLDKEVKAIALHCYANLNHFDLAKTAALLKPIGVLGIVRECQALNSPDEIFVKSHDTSTTDFHLQCSVFVSEYLIKYFFDALINAVYSEANSLGLLQTWFGSYRDMVAIASMKESLSAIFDVEMKHQFCLMEIVFLVLQSFDNINSTAAKCARKVCEKFAIDDDQCQFKFRDEVPLNLEQIMKIIFQSMPFETFIKIQLHHHVTDHLFCLFFPVSNKKYNKENVEFFLTFVNKQSDWILFSQEGGHVAKSDDLQFTGCINLAKLKFQLDKILQIGWNNNGMEMKPLYFYKSEACIRIGEIIMEQCSETLPSEYVPPYLQLAQENKHPLMQQALANLYFFTVLEKLQNTKYTASRLSTIISEIDKGFEACNAAAKVVLLVERQAVIEVLLQTIVNSYDVVKTNDLRNLIEISDEINNLITEQSQRDLLLMLWIRKCQGPRGVSNLLSEKNKQWWLDFNCFKSIREQLKVKDLPLPTSHLFPFMVDSKDQLYRSMSSLYSETCQYLHSLANKYSELAVQKFIKFANSKSRCEGKGLFHMMIWLGVYHEFYSHKKTSQNLISLFSKVRHDIDLPDEHFSVLKCFLDPVNMIKLEEIPYAQTLELSKDHEMQQHCNILMKDALWEFFDPKNQDPLDTDLRNALANMIAVVFALPMGKTHMWYHMFCPEELEHSYIPGFMYPAKVKKGGLMYDCGFELSEDGQYGRMDYTPHATRGTLSLYSWYLMLWTNFGSFCVGLLTQPKTYEKLHGQLLSDSLSVRDYCITQLRNVWKHIRTNLILGKEEASFFMMRSMHTLFMLFKENNFPFDNGLFLDLKSLDAYESAWHKEIYVPSKANLHIELEKHCSNSVWTLPIVKNIRALDQQYPHILTEEDYMKSLVTAREMCSLNSGFLILHYFTLEYKRLQLGGVLLLDLLEFYQWIHSNLSHLVTYQQAKEITIGQVISSSTKRYSKEVSDHLKDLFDRIVDRYNNYLKMNGGVIGDITCSGYLESTGVQYISENTPLIRSLSQEDTTKDDWLYIIIMDIITNHNTFITIVYSNSTPFYWKYLPSSPPESNHDEVTKHTCIVPFDEDDRKQQFWKLIKKHCMYDGSQSNSTFDLEKLERDVLAMFIAGKPLIKVEGIRTTFRFRNKGGHNPGCAVNLSDVAQELPSEYKLSLPEEITSNFECHFRTAPYYVFNKIVTGLRIVIGYLIQDIKQNQGKVLDSTLHIKLADYLKRHYHKDQNVFDEIGIQSIDTIQMTLLENIEMKRLFKCMELFVGWLQGGLYDYSSLPISMFNHLKEDDKMILELIPETYSDTGHRMNDLLNDLDEFQKALSHTERYLTSHMEEVINKSVKQLLVELSLCNSDEKFITLVPDTILVCHYIPFQMALRKLKEKVTGMARLQPRKQSESAIRWEEVIWKQQPEVTLLNLGKHEESDSDNENLSDQSDDENDSFQKHEKQIAADLQTKTQVEVCVPKPIPEQIKKAKEDMETEDLCQWLKEKKIEAKYVELFIEKDIDGSVLADFEEDDLEGLGIPTSFVRKKILAQFKSNTTVQLSENNKEAMSTGDLCKWLTEKKVDKKYVELFETNDIDGCTLAVYDDKDLNDLGIHESYIRKKIMVQFRKL